MLASLSLGCSAGVTLALPDRGRFSFSSSPSSLLPCDFALPALLPARPLSMYDR